MSVGNFAMRTRPPGCRCNSGCDTGQNHAAYGVLDYECGTHSVNPNSMPSIYKQAAVEFTNFYTP